MTDNITITIVETTNSFSTNVVEGIGDAPVDGSTYGRKDAGWVFTPSWGTIAGTLSDQTDLQNALNAKIDTSEIGVSVQAFNQELQDFADSNILVTGDNLEGIGALDMDGTLTVDGSTVIVKNEEASANIALTVFSDANWAPSWFSKRTRGTEGGETAVQSGDTLGFFGFVGWHDNSDFSGTAASISVQADGNFTDASNPTRIIFSTTPSGSTTLIEAMRIDPTGYVGFGDDNPAERITLKDAVGSQIFRYTMPSTSMNGGAMLGETQFYGVEPSTNRTGVYSAIRGIAFDPAGDGTAINGSQYEGGGISFWTGVDLSGGNSAFTFAEKARMTAIGDWGFGTILPLGKGHFDQESTSRAIPVLYLDQADVSEEMIQFETTVGVGNAIEGVGGKSLTGTHFVKVTVTGGLTRYIEVGTIA